jgi:hypothetical protein
MSDILDRAGSHLLACCNQPRYRTAWLVGPPLSGKTTLARRICSVYGWHYVNYVLEPGYFDVLQDRIESYQPGDLEHDIRTWCTEHNRMLVIDEIDAVLATWPIDQRQLFVWKVSRIPDISHGLILVSNLFDGDTLASLLPESDIPAYFHLAGEFR